MESISEHLTPLDFPYTEIEEAWEHIWAHVKPLPAVEMPFQRTPGLVLAESIRAREPFPPFPASTVDGYALRSAEGDAWRTIVGEQRIGTPAQRPLQPGEAVWVATGAVVPEGADAVVEVEASLREGSRMRPRYVPTPGHNIRPVGFDIRGDEEVLLRGTRIGPAEVGVLATVNALRVRVHPRPRVAVISTGDELVPPGTPLSPGKIRESNRYTLLAAVELYGGEAVDRGSHPDEPSRLRAALIDAVASADMVVTCGGVSMGNRDYLKTLLAELGHIHFGRVRVKPGKPATFATVQGTPVFSLPGNPVSALVGFYLYVLPAMRILGGTPGWEHPWTPVRLAHPIRREPGRVEFQRARLRREGGTWWAETTGEQASSRLLSFVGADALIRLPAEGDIIPQGTEVPAFLLRLIPF